MKRGIKGFTLMEVLVCCTLLVSVIGMSSALILTASRYLENSRTQLLRTYVAQQVMSEILEAGYEGIDTLEPTGSYNIETKYRGKERSLTFSYRITVVEPEESVKSVLLVIGEASGRETSYETLLTEFM